MINFNEKQHKFKYGVDVKILCMVYKSEINRRILNFLWIGFFNIFLCCWAALLFHLHWVYVVEEASKM